MVEQIYNPYLPLREYVPDGEPHLFDGRVYIYGSHDEANGTVYCPGDYAAWSAPEDNLKEWKYEGVIYRKTQDPSNEDGKKQLWAPDVTKGPDGRYYMYYCFSFFPEVGVAVSDSPAGPFEFYGHVHYPQKIMNGKVLQENMPFDPAVLTDDDGKVYLYYGFAPAEEKAQNMPEFTEEDIAALPDDIREMAMTMIKLKMGEDSMVAELEADMVTLKEVPRPMIPGGNHTKNTGFEGHGFFEASSIRKVNEKYYFVYSSHKSHELCYAVSEKPDRDFIYGGVIISNGDMGLNGRKQPVYTLGNNHGGIVQANGEWYIFYHRQTNGTEFSRQGCAEKICILEDGTIPQVEITSCGLNGGPLKGSGIYPAAIACHMTCSDTMDKIDYQNPIMRTQTRITEQQNITFITSIKNGTVLGYKYFLIDDIASLILELRGDFEGTVKVLATESEEDLLGKQTLKLKTDVWSNVRIMVQLPKNNVTALYFYFEGVGVVDMRNFAFL